MSSLSNTAIEMRLSLLESGTNGSGGSGGTSSEVSTTSSDGSTITGTNLYVAYATSVLDSDTFGRVQVQASVQGFRLSRDIAFDESGDVLPWVGLLTSSSPFQSEDPVDYIWSNSTTESVETTSSFERWYTINPGLAAFIGDPDNPGDGIYWQKVPTSGEVPSSAFWMSERYTIGGSTTAWQLRPMRVSENFLPFVKYSKVGTAPILNTSTWDVDVIEAVADQTGLPYSNIRELGYGTVVTIDYDDGTSRTGILKQVDGLTVWDTPGEMIPGNLVVSGTIAGDKIQANSITAGQIGVGEITADHLEAGAINAQAITVDGNIHIKEPEEGYCLNGSYTDKESCESETGGGSTWKEEYSSGFSAGDYTTGHTSFLYPDGSADRPLPVDSSIFLGIDNLEEIAETKSKFFVGNKNEYISWNGSKLSIGGNIVTSGNIQSMDGSKIILATYKLDGRDSGPDMSARVDACIPPFTAAANGQVIEFDIDIWEEVFEKNLVPVVWDANSEHMDNGWTLEYGKLGADEKMYSAQASPIYDDGTTDDFYNKQTMTDSDWSPINGIFKIRKEDFPYTNFKLRLSVNTNFAVNKVGFNAFAGGLSEDITIDLNSIDGTSVDLSGYDFTKVESIQATGVYGYPIAGDYCIDQNDASVPQYPTKASCEDYSYIWSPPWLTGVMPEFVSTSSLLIHGFSGTEEVGVGRVTITVNGY